MIYDAASSTLPLLFHILFDPDIPHLHFVSRMHTYLPTDPPSCTFFPFSGCLIIDDFTTMLQVKPPFLFLGSMYIHFLLLSLI